MRGKEELQPKVVSLQVVVVCVLRRWLQQVLLINIKWRGIHSLCVLVCALAGCADLPRLQLHLSPGVILHVCATQLCQEML